MSTETAVAAAVIALVLLALHDSGPRRRRSRHVLRRAVRFVRRPRRSLSTEYVAYISSPAWRRVREKALLRARGRCEHRGIFGRCRARYGLQVHHRNYRTFGREWDGVRTHGECLEVLCRRHHAAADTRRRRRGG